MGGGLTFLSKKSFNPSNIANQRRVWEARQQSESERRRLVEREAQIKREREEEELARVIGGEEEGGRKALGFMYEAGKVPGLKKEGNCNNNSDYDQHEKTNNVANDDEGNLFQRQPGDDDAAAAFRAMLAQGIPNGDIDMQERNQVAEIHTADEDTADNSNNEPSSRDNRTNLEKAVGRGINSGSGVTLAQQMERFPMLKAAPKVLQKQRNTGDKSEQASANDVAGMNFKPLGQVIRNVQCMACKKWGHARGERECELSGWNPFQMSAPPAAATSSIAADISSSTAAAPNNALQQRDERKEGEITTLKSDKKHSKKRHKDDRHDRKKKSKKHKRRRRERSPSYSYSDDSSSYSSEEERYRKKRRRDYSSDDSYDRRRSRKKERRKKSSRK